MPLDPRVVKVGIQIGNELKTYEDLAIYATGSKFTNLNQGQAEVTLINLNRDERERLMTECSPFNSNPDQKSVIIECGNQSTGTSVLYQGDIFRVSVTGKPDIGLTLKCLTGNYRKESVVATSFDKSSSFIDVAKKAAEDAALNFSFEGITKNIGNFVFSGSAFDQIKSINDLTDDDVYIDNNELVVKERTKARAGSSVKILNKTTGMVGIPESTENGVKVTMLYDPQVNVGSRIRLTSEINPVLNGDYLVYKLDFDISSRDTQYYLNAEARRLPT